MGRNSARLVVADSRKLYSEAICRALGGEFEARTVADIRSLSHSLSGADLLIIASELAVQGGSDALSLARAQHPGIKLMVIADRQTRLLLRHCWQSGVAGFLTRDCGLEELVQTITDVLQGKQQCAPAAMVPDSVPVTGGGYALTGRQMEVLRLVSEGLSAKEIAHHLHVSQRTVEFHKANIMRLLGLRSSPEMIRFAMEWRPDLMRHIDRKDRRTGA
jgi:DNA-binding NarL/FixJ family response regulator